LDSGSCQLARQLEKIREQKGNNRKKKGKRRGLEERK
jgi:hypothetical protein